MKPLRACWREIRTFLGENKNPAGVLAGNPDFSWRGIRSRHHSNRSGTSHLHKILDFLGREQIVFGIDINIGNFKPKSIFWEGF